MRAYDNGCFFTVAVSAREVETFARCWPCSGLNRSKGVWFQYDKRNGDLVDTNDERNQPNANGGAIVALSEDAQRYGEKRLGIKTPHKESES